MRKFYMNLIVLLDMPSCIGPKPELHLLGTLFAPKVPPFPPCAKNPIASINASF